jgi:hypothetical protein
LANWAIQHHSPPQFALNGLTLLVPFFKEKKILEHEHHYKNTKAF